MRVILFLAPFFALLAALATFLITYEEYRKHFPEKRKALKMALGITLAAFLFFLMLGALLFFFFRR